MRNNNTISQEALQGLPSLDPNEIIKERGKTRGDFEIMMRMFTKQIEARLSVSLQQPISLPANFGALTMAMDYP